LASLQALKPINVQTHILFCSAILLLLLLLLLTLTSTPSKSSLLIAVCLGIEIISQFFFSFDFIFRGSPISIGNHFKVVYKLIPKLRLNVRHVCMEAVPLFTIGIDN